MRIVIGQEIIDILRFKKFAWQRWLIVLLYRIIYRDRWRYKYSHKKYPNLGRNSYIGSHSVIASRDTHIGKFCSIADYVEIGTTFHPKHFLSTHPFSYTDSLKVAYSCHEMDMHKIKLVKYINITPCLIGNDVWIGCQSIIMDGVKVGNGAIIGANSVITKDVPPYAIVVGTNRIVGYRFSQEIIDDLLELKWWDLPEKYLYDLPFDDINACIKRLKEIRKMFPVDGTNEKASV